MQNTYYKDGFRPECSNTHKWRTAENSLNFMLPKLDGEKYVLDVGCGPGTITIDLAKTHPNLKIVGIDTVPELIKEASENAKSQNVHNVSFQIANGASLPFDDNSFDIAYSHQVLLHVSAPSNILSEMRRVVKEGGQICCKDADMDSLIVYPTAYESKIRECFTEKMIGPDTSITCGRRLKEIAMDCGFGSNEVVLSSSSLCVSTAEERKWFADLYHKRIIKTMENSTSSEIKEMLDAWHNWVDNEASVLILTHFEIICTKP